MPRVYILPDDQICHSIETNLPLEELLLRIKSNETGRLPARKYRPLTIRQRQVLQGVMDGHTIDQIALRLKLSPRTVRLHLSCLKRLFQAETLAQLTARAVEVDLSSTKAG